jgi:transposase
VKKHKLAIGALFTSISDFCKANFLNFRQKTGRPARLSFAEVLTIFIAFLLSRKKDFKAFYCGTDGALLREIFPAMTCYSAFLRRLPLLGKILVKALQTTTGTGFFIVDSTSFKLCENVRFYSCRLFPEFAAWAHSSTRCIFGFKLHIAIDERGKIVAFRLTKGSKHDIREAENLLRGRIGTAIGDRGYCSSQVKKRLAQKGLRFITHARKNMKNGNTKEEKHLLQRRNLVERVFGKLKRLVGDSFSRFRAWGTAQATIAVGILVLNLSI